MNRRSLAGVIITFGLLSNAAAGMPESTTQPSDVPLSASRQRAASQPAAMPEAAGGVPSEWTLEQARECWKPMTRSVQHVGVPGYQFQAGVMWDGALVFGPLAFRELKVMQQETAPLDNHLLHVSFGYGQPMRLIDRKGTANPLIRRRLEHGRLPVPHIETRDGDLAWNETVFAHLLGRPPDQWLHPRKNDLLVVHALFTVRNTGHARRTGRLWMHFGDTSQVRFGYKCEQLPELGREIPCRFDPPFARMGHGIRYLIPKPQERELVWHDSVAGARLVLCQR